MHHEYDSLSTLDWIILESEPVMCSDRESNPGRLRVKFNIDWHVEIDLKESKQENTVKNHLE